MNSKQFKYHHLGIPTTKKMAGEKYFETLKFYHSGFEDSEFGIEWMRFEDDSPLPELVKTVPHLAFEVENLEAALIGRNILIEPNSPSDGITVAFIQDNGAPIELLEIKKSN